MGLVCFCVKWLFFFFFLAILVVMPCVLLPIFLATKHLFSAIGHQRGHPRHDFLQKFSLSFSPSLRGCGERNHRRKLPVALPPLHSIHLMSPEWLVLIQPIRNEDWKTSTNPVALLRRLIINSSWWLTGSYFLPCWLERNGRGPADLTEKTPEGDNLGSCGKLSYNPAFGSCEASFYAWNLYPIFPKQNEVGY